MNGLQDGTIFGGCETLKGPLWAIKVGTLVFDTFVTL